MSLRSSLSLSDVAKLTYMEPLSLEEDQDKKQERPYQLRKRASVRCNGCHRAHGYHFWGSPDPNCQGPEAEKS